jgi:hypothetical protein
MSPILKRDVGEQIRQAKRLASVITGHTLDNNNDHGYEQIHQSQYDNDNGNGNAYATSSSSSSRRGIGIGIEGDEEDTGPPGRGSWERKTFPLAQHQSVKGKERALTLDEDIEDDDEEIAMLPLPLDESGMRMEGGHGRGRTAVEWFRDEVLSMSPSRWIDLRNLLLEVSPPTTQK